MTLIAAWILFPAVLALLALGCGLLLEQASGERVAGPLLPATGLATIIVVGEFATATDATAELAVPLALGLAIAGFALSVPWRRARPDGWEIGAAVAVFAIFAAPIVLSGKATFAGYIKLDDTSTWMAFTDWVMEHGPRVHDLAPSSYEATLAVNLPGGYPIGSFLPLGIGQALSGQDVAWVIQPYMALMAAMLALALVAIARPLLPASYLRGVTAFMAAQSALLLGYSLWGGVKELVAAVLLALVAASVPSAVRSGAGVRATIPLAVAVSALVAVSSVGAAAWLIPLLAPALIAAVRGLGATAGAIRAAAFAFLAALLTLPALLAAGAVVKPTSGALVSEAELGNLIEPLSSLQVFGIWPVGDFRLEPGAIGFTYVLIAIAAATAVICVWRAVKAAAWSLLLYTVGVSAGCLMIVVVGSPWVGAKALAAASPAVLFAAAAGAATLVGDGRRLIGTVTLVAIAAGVITSNVLAYREVNLAPRDELAEAESIGDAIAGQGPTLIAADQIYAARHFLRDADPEAPSELRRRTILLRDGTPADKPLIGGTDAIALSDLLIYKTLVIPRSPTRSRPPMPYTLIRSGRYYDVWQRPDTPPVLVDHLSLGDEFDPAAVPNCAEVLELARRAGPGSRLVAALPTSVTVIPLMGTVHPMDWVDPVFPNMLVPKGSGSIAATVPIRNAGPYAIWLGGSVRAGLELLVDGVRVGSIRHQLTNGQYILLGQTDLDPGPHQIMLRYSGADWHPGSANTATLAYPIGPLVVGRPVADPGVSYIDRSQARDFCGKRWDWIEAVAG